MPSMGLPSRASQGYSGLPRVLGSGLPEAGAFSPPQEEQIFRSDSQQSDNSEKNVNIALQALVYLMKSLGGKR